MSSKNKIDIYPNVPKPDWVKPGVKCYVLGEGQDEFTIDQVLSNRVTLTKGKYAHGAESFEKLVPLPFNLRYRVHNDGTVVFPYDEDVLDLSDNININNNDSLYDAFESGVTIGFFGKYVTIKYSDNYNGWILT